MILEKPLDWFDDHLVGLDVHFLDDILDSLYEQLASVFSADLVNIVSLGFKNIRYHRGEKDGTGAFASR